MAKTSRNRPRSPGAVPIAATVRSASAKSRSWWLFALQIAAIVAAVLWIYLPVRRGGWLMDDLNYFTENPLLRDTSGLWKIWFEPGSFIEYYPILASAEWCEWNLFGNDTLGYHLITIVLHIANALLVWWLLGKFGLRLAWLGGLIFAVHPVMVETVAWMSELKNTLALLPFLLAMGAWIDYEKDRKWRDYGLALGLFLVAMLCKISMVTFPVTILLYAWWTRGRIGWTDLKASAPFFVVSVTLGIVSIAVGTWFQQHRMVLDPVQVGGVWSRLACSGLALGQYFLNCLWPPGLMPIYPHWKVDPPSPAQFLPWPILGGILYWLWRNREGWGRHGLLGLGFFVLNLMPFLGFITVSYMSYTWVMDHFLYLPILGLIGLVVAGLEQMAGRFSRRWHPLGIAGIGIVVTLLAWGSHGYASAFINEQALATCAIECNPGAWTAYNNLGVALQDAGRYGEAVDVLEQGLRIKPEYVEARYNLGNALLHAGRCPEAIERYEEVINMQPNYPQAHNNLAVALAQMGRYPEAIEEFKAELQLYPNDEATRLNMEKVEQVEKAAAQKH